MHLVRVTSLRQSNAQLRAFLDRIDQVRAKDAQDHAAALSARQKRRRAGWALTGGAAAAVLVLGYLLLRKR